MEKAERLVREGLKQAGWTEENLRLGRKSDPVKNRFLLGFLECVAEVAAKLKEPDTHDRKFEDVVKSAEKAAVLMPVSGRLTECAGRLVSFAMATKTIHVSLPGELSGYVERKVKAGRYQDASEVIREALRQMEAAELAGELAQFERAFTGGHDHAETAEDIRRVEHAVRAGRKG